MYYSYSTTGAYRRVKAIIDIANIVIGILVALVFILSFFVPAIGQWRYIAVFGLGAVMNFITGAKKLMEQNRRGGIGLIVIAIFLLIMMMLSIFA